jgi:hypothetical protein
MLTPGERHVDSDLANPGTRFVPGRAFNLQQADNRQFVIRGPI